MVFDKLKEKILEKSKSHQFYKNSYISNNNPNENIEFSDKINDIENSIEENKKFSREILYANIFNDTIKESKWLNKKNFSLNKSSSSYSFLYILYRILDEFKPNNILELGLGQSSKITSQYVSHYHDNLDIIENDEEWIKNFSKNLELSDNFNIINLSTESFIYNSSENLRYKDFSNNIKNNTYDLVIIDGPYGYNQEYPRSNLWEIIDFLEKDFIIIIDDYERKGEQNTVLKFFKLLDEKNIEYETVEFEGIKKQLIIYSPEYKFIKWF